MNTETVDLIPGTNGYDTNDLQSQSANPNSSDTTWLRRCEEKDQIISRLKQSLVDLTEKRFRALNNNINGDTTVHPSALQSNLQFVLDEKDGKIGEQQTEIDNLKEVIKSQDNVIFNHNNNINELTSNHETVLKAKQDSFRVMQEDLLKKQRLIEDQEMVIKSLKEKIEQLEENFSEDRSDLETKLNEKNADLQMKIASFEANLYQGRQYFEEMLNEKDTIIQEKTSEISRLKSKHGEAKTGDTNGRSDSDEDIETASIADSTISKYDDENMKNMKALYEHQMEMLRVKIALLEKTCANYKQGIKDMNKSFGYQQHADEMSSIQTFKDLMQDLQKTNAVLETERIDLQVNNSKLSEALDNTKREKENLNKKFIASDQLSQRLQNERHEFELNYKNQLQQKITEITGLNSKIAQLNFDLATLTTETERLQAVEIEHQQLTNTHQELSSHYETLYAQASDIVSGNQLLNEQVAANALQIVQLEEIVEDYQLKVDHLGHCNSQLNTQKIELDMNLAELEAKLETYEHSLKELESLKGSKQEVERLLKVSNELEQELIGKNELLEQLSQAKEYLVENNSKLLTNNIKIQLFVESLGLDLEQLETNASVKEYEFLRSQFRDAQTEIADLKFKNKEIELNSHVLLEKLARKERELGDLQAKFGKEDPIDKEFVAQLEMSFNALQSENEEVCRELSELKEKLMEMSKLEAGFENSKKDLKISEEKLASVEQTNAKLKAKLKQYIKQKKMTEPSNLDKESTPLNIETAPTPGISDQEFKNLQIKFDESNAQIATLLRKIKSLEEAAPEVTVTTATNDESFLRGSEFGAAEIYKCVVAQAEVINEKNFLMALNQELRFRDLKNVHEEMIKSGLNDAKVCELEASLTELQAKYEQQLNLAKIQSDLVMKQEMFELKKSLEQEDYVKAEVCQDGLVESKKQFEEIRMLNQEVEELKKGLEESKLAFIESNSECQRLAIELDSVSLLLNEKINEIVILNQTGKSADEDANLRVILDSANAQIDEMTIREKSLKEELAQAQQKHENLRLKVQASKKNKKEKSPKLESPDETDKSEELAKLQAELAQKEAAFKDLNQTYSNQMAQFESNFRELQDERDLLATELTDLKVKTNADMDELKSKSSELDELTIKLADLKSIELDYTKLKQTIDETNTKLASVEQLNLKYKTKLKQMLKQKQLHQQLQGGLTPTGSLTPCSIQIPEDGVSTVSTPFSFSPNCQQVNTASFETQTDLSSEMIEQMQNDSSNLSEQLGKLRLEVDMLNEKMIASKMEFDSSIQEMKRVNEELEQRINENKEPSNLQELNEKLETIQQQNTKLKAKLKQVLKKDKEQSKESSVEPVDTSDQLSLLTNKINLLTRELAELPNLREQNVHLQDLLNEKTSELQRIQQNLSSQRTSPTRSISNNPSPTPLSFETLIEQKQKTIDGLTGVLNLTSAQLENEKYNNEILMQSLETEIYNKDLQINELRTHIDHLSQGYYPREPVLVEQVHLGNALQNNEVNDCDVSKLKIELDELKLAVEAGAQREKYLSEQCTSQVTEIGELNEKHTMELNELKKQVDEKSRELESVKDVLSAENSRAKDLEVDLQKVQDQIQHLKEDLSVKTEQLTHTLGLQSSLDNLTKEQNFLIAKFNTETEALSNKILDFTISESNLRNLLNEKQVEVSHLINEIGALRNNDEVSVKLFEKKFRDELALKEENLVQVNEDLLQAQVKLEQASMDHEKQMANLEQTYFEQLNSVKQQNELNSSNSDLEFERQILDKQEELDRKERELFSVVEKVRLLEMKVEGLEAELATAEIQIKELKQSHEMEMVQVLKQNEDNLNDITTRFNAEIQSRDESNHVFSSKAAELQNLIMHKQKMTEDLTSQINELKMFIDAQRVQQEQQIAQFMASLKEKDIKLNCLSTEVNELKLMQNQPTANRITASASLGPNEFISLNTANSSDKDLPLEAQLKHCHEKCELVVGTLSQLKLQNESLNNRIKSYRHKVEII